MKIITLNKGFETIVDDDAYEHLSQFRWLVNVGRTGYVYAVGQIEGKRNWLHRYMCSAPGLVVDHINGNTLDNRRENLRAVTPADNARNINAAPRSNTGERSIYKRKRDGLYSVTSSSHGKGRIYIGSYRTLARAVSARDAYESTAKGEVTIRTLLERIAELEEENTALRAAA